MAKSVKQPVETSPYLKQVRIRDYRSIRDAKVDFKPGLNIIIGGNGAGKTNFLSLTSTLANPFNTPTEGVKCELVIYAEKDLKAVFKSKKPTEAKHRKGINSILNAPEYLLMEVTDGISIVESDYLMDAFGDLLGHDPFYETVPVWHGTPMSQLPVVSDNVEMLFVRSGSLKLKDTGSNSGIVQTSRFVEALRQTIEAGLDELLPRTEKRIPIIEVSTESIKKMVEQLIDAQLAQLIPLLSLYSPIQSIRRFESWQVYFNKVQEEILLKGLVLEFLVNNQWLPFNALSDGTKRLFYIISEIEVASLFDVKLNSEGVALNLKHWDKIIFLEEPELGIHPDQLQKLLTLIREVSDKHQVIMTTHSPQVLDMLRKDELDRITICELDPKKGTQFRKLSAATKAKAKAYMRDDSYLSDFWRFSTLERHD